MVPPSLTMTIAAAAAVQTQSPCPASLTTQPLVLESGNYNQLALSPATPAMSLDSLDSLHSLHSLGSLGSLHSLHPLEPLTVRVSAEEKFTESVQIHHTYLLCQYSLLMSYHCCDFP